MRLILRISLCAFSSRNFAIRLSIDTMWARRVKGACVPEFVGVVFVICCIKTPWLTFHVPSLSVPHGEPRSLVIPMPLRVRSALSTTNSLEYPVLRDEISHVPTNAAFNSASVRCAAAATV